ncbi:hypothetical protein FOY51_16650 [Antrihabitans cavernicola]|uniref:Uncharacterized protein n=1 Tax=Antrihabitans cavernicola TaxID=2495913 RepID=A0A5A7S789_9NOCA|nr:hypothetical protein FOY51_16650 [Spelaeibacter cavernicola]
MSFLDLLANFELGKSWEGCVTIAHEGQRMKRVQLVARTHAMEEQRRARCILHDITDIDPPAPLLDAAALRLVAGASGTGVGLVGLDWGVIYEWLSAPAAPLDRWVEERPEIHPEDLSTFEAACRRMCIDSDQESVEMRVRFEGDQWVDTIVELELATRSTPPQGIIRVTPIGR